MHDIGLFQIHQNRSITDAFETIDKNTYGVVVVVDDDKKVLGLATDGDIRRWLIKHADIDAPIRNCMNPTFKFANERTPREQILKTLDHKIHVVPVLDSEGRLREIVTRCTFPLPGERRVFARSKSPVRISFGGGGTDLTHYFVENGGAVMNATISMYSRSTLRKRTDSRIKIYSHDLKTTVEADSLIDLRDKNKLMPLIISLVSLIKPSYGFELQVGSDFPVGSGLGGSAVVLASIIGCFNQFREDRWDNYEMAEMAFQAERLTLDVSGGWQDQYATVFGGFNFMEFTKDNNVVHPLRLPADLLSELEESLVLCFVGGSHQSGDIHKDQKNEMQREDVRALVARNKELTYKMKNDLLRGQLQSFGHALHEAWQLKRQFSSKISNPKFDELYELARKNGALGGKLLGAGGGGYFLFFVEPFQRFDLITALTESGLRCQAFNFDHQGLQAWTVREDEL